MCDGDPMPKNVNTTELLIDTMLDETSDDRPTMISVDHVTMTFNMASEQLNSLKEYAIKLLQRDLFFKEFKALDDVSFEVKKGDVFGIVGTNGSGKSTILKIIAGVLDPSEGSCEVNGNIAPLIELGAGFDLDLSARENIYLNGALLGYSKEFIDQNFDSIVAFAEVGPFLDMPMKNYSSGMVARIAFAIATIIIPDILIVDEVLAVGDFMFQKKCEDRINQLIEQHGVTVLIVSHSNEQISRLCNKAVWIEKGHVRLMGDAKQVCDVYSALGGRSGGREAEREVLQAMARSRDLIVPEAFATIVEEDTASAICSDLTLSALDRAKAISGGLSTTGTSADEAASQRTVALCCDSTHCNAVVGNALASAFGAPMFSIGRLSIADPLAEYLDEEKPERILVFDVGRCMSESLAQLKALSWGPEIVFFGKDDDPCLFSLEVYEFGLSEDVWGDRLAIIGFWDNPEAMALSPYLYRTCTPVLMPSDYDLAPEDRMRMMDAIKDKDVLVAGSQTNEKFKAMGEEVREAPAAIDELATEQSFSNFADIARFVEKECSRADGRETTGMLYLAPASHWYDLLTIGYVVATEDAQLVLVDDASLDSILEAFRYVSVNAQTFAQVTIVGDSFVQGGLDPQVFYCLWSESSAE